MNESKSYDNYGFWGFNGLTIELSKEGNKTEMVPIFSRITWMEAENYCRSIDSHLISIHSQTQMDLIAYDLLQFIPGYIPSGIWIGLHDEQAEGAWIWSDGTTFDYTNWDILNGEPNSYNYDGMCCICFVCMAWVWVWIFVFCLCVICGCKDSKIQPFFCLFWMCQGVTWK